LNEPDSSDVT